MKITIKRTEDQLNLIRQMGSSDKQKAYEAQAAIAKLLSPVISEVINNAPTISNLYSTLTFEEDDNPSIPLDLYHDITDENFINVYSQQVAGGLPYSQVFPSHNELKFSTFDLDSALAFDTKYVRRARVDVVAKTFTRMAQEILLKQERTAFNVLATAMIKGNSKVGLSDTAAAGNHIIGGGIESRLKLDDFNRLLTHSKRINASFSSGTPATGVKTGLTDLLVSPEMVQEIRAMSYNPVNTQNPAGTAATAGHTALAADDSLRSQIYSASGLPSFYGINIMEILELGVGQRFNKIFDAIVTSEGATVIGGGSAGTFSQGDDEILIGIDRSRESLLRPVMLKEGGGQLEVMVDDQFNARQKKIGYYGNIEEGRVCIEDRALVGLVI